LRTLFLTVSVPVFLSLFLVESDASDASNTISEPVSKSSANNIATAQRPAGSQHAASCGPKSETSAGVDGAFHTGSSRTLESTSSRDEDRRVAGLEPWGQRAACLPPIGARSRQLSGWPIHAEHEVSALLATAGSWLFLRQLRPVSEWSLAVGFPPACHYGRRQLAAVLPGLPDLPGVVAGGGRLEKLSRKQPVLTILSMVSVLLIRLGGCAVG